MKIISVGHSIRKGADFTALLAHLGVECLADVRRTPYSKRNPQFQKRSLRYSVEDAGIEYLWLGDTLGGQQPEHTAFEQSDNRAWQEPALRNYADAIPTPEFSRGLRALESAAARKPTAIMCAERDWRQCHRQILCDLLVARGWQVMHCAEIGQSETHRLSAWARYDEGKLSYPTLL